MKMKMKCVVLFILPPSSLASAARSTLAVNTFARGEVRPSLPGEIIMEVDKSEMEERVSRLSDEELLRMLNTDTGLYRKEALDCVKSEMAKRGVTSDSKANGLRSSKGTGEEGPTSRVSKLRRKVFNKQVLLGAGAGILAGILFTIGGAFIVLSVLDRSNTAKVEKGLKPPLMPSQITVDYNWTVHSLDGREFNMADAKGKVVLVNFWATWCLPCRAEMSSIQRLYDKVKDEGVIFLCVSKEDGATVSEFVREKGYTFPIFTRSPELPSAFDVEAIPTTFIIGPDGKIALRYVGAAKWDDEGSVNFIRGLRSQP